MPSVEIICLEQVEPLTFKDRPFVIEAENELISHRSPSSLFQSEFDRLRGCIYHLGNLRGEHESKGYYTAYDLMNQDSQWYNHIQFADEFAGPIKSLLEKLIAASLTKTIVFTNDYQFGPAARKHLNSRSLNEFWKQHGQGKLWMNAMYYLGL